MSIDHNHKSNAIYIGVLTTSHKTFAAGPNGVKRLSRAFTHIVSGIGVIGVSYAGGFELCTGAIQL